jgi:hypothetical protein
MIEVWTREASDGRIITFKKEGDEEVGFMYYAQGRVATNTLPSKEELPREMVEAYFADYLAGPKPAKGVQVSEPEPCGNPKCRHERGQHWDDVCHVEGCLCARFVRA